MIFQLSDWFPKPMISSIIAKFDQIRKNWWRISCAEILKVGKNFFAASSVKKMPRFEGVSPEEIKRIAWKFTKTVFLLGLAGYELIITNSAYGSYPELPRRITLKYKSEQGGEWVQYQVDVTNYFALEFFFEKSDVKFLPSTRYRTHSNPSLILGWNLVAFPYFIAWSESKKVPKTTNYAINKSRD